MAAYAALVSLMNTLLNIQHHHRFSNSLDNKQVESLNEKLDFLLNFVESTTHTQNEEAQVLESQIASTAFAAEDVIESHIVDQIHTGSLSLLDLQAVIQDMDHVKEKVVKQRGLKYVQSTYLTSFPTLSTPLTPKSRMVGLDDELIRLLNVLTGHQSSLQIIPIVGMGGIGKTTLARNVYEKQLIVQRFDFRAWVTVSQQYSVRDIFAKLLSCDSGETDEHELGEQLHKRLIGRRYLIILDDIWSIEAWHSMKRFFPDNNDTSRVVITTRLASVATQFEGTSSFQLGLLDENKSWELFCENAFPGEGCLPDQDLEELGMKIAKKCKGLPLLIVVIGALLRKSSVEYWENISENIHSILSSGEEESLDILSLSYNHLPAHLKPCFLYMGTLKEDDEIIISDLIKVWVAEGFVKPSATQSLEVVAKGYIKDLVGRNLIHGWSNWSKEEIEWCSIHDLLRDLCLEKARKQNFLCVMRVGDIRQGIYTYNQGRVPKPSFIPEDSDIVESTFLARNGDSMSLKFKMLRILNATDCYYGDDCILKQVNLRYISIHDPLRYNQNSSDLHSSISLLWNLQILIINGEKIVAPREIWEMPHLRHVNVTKTIWLPDPTVSKRQDHDQFVMRNLQTLWRVYLNLTTEEVCKRIPNIKRLGVIYEEDNVKRMASYDFGRLDKLEALCCRFLEKPSLKRVDLLQYLGFPISLQELSLQGCGLHWEDLTIIGSLPHLLVLQLKEKSVIGSEWNPVEGEFLHLRLLELYYCNYLTNWNANKSHFPVLEKLLLHGLENLNEIPSGLGEIPILAQIKVYDCSESSSISAVKILDEQESFGNESLQVHIGFQSREKLQSFKEEIEQFGSCTSNNLQIGWI